MLLAKLAGVAGVVSCGWHNWQRIRSGRAPYLAVMLAEVLCGFFVLAVTGVLTEIEHP